MRKRPLTRIQMEARRMKAVKFLMGGLKQSKVARFFGVSRTTASRWSRLLEAEGEQALRLRKAPGRPCRLSTGQQKELEDLYRGDPKRWTGQRTADLIFEHFGIRYDRDHAGRILLRLRAAAGVRERAKGAGQ